MIRWILGLAVVVAVSGCGRSSQTVDGYPEAAESTTSARTTLTNPTLQPPQQTNENGLLDVIYDPCTWIPDAVISGIGFDPGTRERSDLVAERTTLGCTFAASIGQLLLMSGNTPYQGQVDRYRDRIVDTVDFGDRPAIVVPDDIEPDTCFVIMKSEVGAVLVARTTYANTTTPCEGIVEFAAKIESTIGEEN